MQTAVAETRHESGSPAKKVEIHSQYLLELHGLIDEIEAKFPEVVRVLRKRIADLEQLLAKGENPFIEHGCIAATHEVVRAVHRVIQRVVGETRLGNLP